MARTRAQKPKPLARYFQLSSRSHHGLMFVVEVARGWQRGTTVTVRSAATRVGLSPGYLEELAAALRGAGIIRGSRGRGGGYTLARPPAQITMGDIVRPLDGPVILTHCQDPAVARSCPVESWCATRHFFGDLKATIDRTLDGTALATLVGDEQYERET